MQPLDDRYPRLLPLPPPAIDIYWTILDDRPPPLLDLICVIMHYLANVTGLSTFWLKKCFCPDGGVGGGVWGEGDWGLGKCTIWLMSPGIEQFLAEKCSCMEGVGVISQNAMQVAYISIMHCSLPVISLLTCWVKRKYWRLAPAYIVKLQIILGY